ncbi:uncharacterized protein LOC132739555 [Ruditapes philippinarum]|uniref:uncharacterized protein LOC132739555 n=1 Tax=Ruditapes philippinarum TaxID=129788 RepID=UPI00295AEC28|nr:uncharacterized protein LOC132739555 [Ruditapes philippinarum]
MFIKLVAVMFLFTGSNFLKAIMLYCGDKGMHRYNSTIQDCINGIVKPKIFLICGVPPMDEKYDVNTHSCVDNKLVVKGTCGIKKLSRRKKCCGDVVYDPRYQTCCTSKHEHRIHDHKQEIKHVCCNLEAYHRRSAKATCHRSAHNDQFFKPKILRLRRVSQKICKEFDHVYKVKVKSQVCKGNRRCLRVRVSRWAWHPLKSTNLMSTSPKQKKHMRVKLDKYSGKKNLTGQLFLILTDRKYSMKKVFRLRFSENIYAFPKNKVLQKRMLSKISKKCMEVLNINKFVLSNG